VGWNRTRAKAEPLAARGMTVAPTPRAAAEAAELTITMVTDNAALEAVLAGDDGILAGLGPGKLLAEMSTTAPDLMRGLAERCSERGATLLDAPVLGSILTLRQGNLLVMVGGPADAFARAEPIFAALGSTVRRVGDVGQAKALKVAANLNLAVQLIALFEGVLLAEKMGIPRRTALDTLLGGVIASPHMKYRAPFVLDPPDHPWFDVGMIQKDLQLALDLGKREGVALPETAVAQQLMTATHGMGYGKEDFAAVFFTLAKMSGVA
jgi:3-hydroxyisobutyrate dehydrogenase-like beta-hydroxyacid dehydrogenase